MHQKRDLSHLFNILVLSLSLLLFSACSHTVSAPAPAKQKSFTKLPKGRAPLLSYLNNTDKKLDNASAFYSLGIPTDAFAARIFLIDQECMFVFLLMI